MSLFSLSPLAVYGQAAASALSQTALAILHLLHVSAELLNGGNESHNLLYNQAVHDSILSPAAILAYRKGNFLVALQLLCSCSLVGDTLSSKALELFWFLSLG